MNVFTSKSQRKISSDSSRGHQKFQYYFHGNMKTLLAIFTVLIFTLVAQKLTLDKTIGASPSIKAVAPILLLIVIAFSTPHTARKI